MVLLHVARVEAGKHDFLRDNRSVLLRSSREEAFAELAMSGRHKKQADPMMPNLLHYPHF
jgi:hypothetical protein